MQSPYTDTPQRLELPLRAVLKTKRKRCYEFRHRHHPAFQRRLYVSVHALSAEHETAPQEKPWRTLQSVGGVYNELEGA